MKKLTRSQVARLKVGDWIKVHTFHYREGRRTVIRKIVEINPTLGVGIRMFGWNPFWLRKGEILEKVEKPVKVLGIASEYSHTFRT